MCEDASVAVPAGWAVSIAKVAVRIVAFGRRVLVNENVMSSSECRPIVCVR